MKQKILGIGGPLHGWITCGTEYESFNLDSDDANKDQRDGVNT
jgi:hypothetical protein